MPLALREIASSERNGVLSRGDECPGKDSKEYKKENVAHYKKGKKN